MCDFIEKTYIHESVFQNMFETLSSFKSTWQQEIDQKIIDNLIMASKYFLNVETGRIEQSFPADLRIFHFEHQKTLHSKHSKVCWKQEGF